MPNPYFQFKQFTVHQAAGAMKVTTDACLFGAWCAEEIQSLNGKKNILDIGTGTGLLPLMIAQKNSASIDAIEIEKASADEAIQNIQASPFAETIHVIQADISGYQPPEKYDIIICNPPFYEDELQSPDALKNVAHHGTHLKLEQLFQIINVLLKEQGNFFLLLPFKRKNEILKMLSDHSLSLYKMINVKQTPAHTPFRLMLAGKRKDEGSFAEEEIIIKNNGNYTNEFVRLLKDYYLYL